MAKGSGMKLKINEIFFSVQGEARYAGWPTVFIRTSGCPLRCQYCDTKYAYYDGQLMPLTDILNSVAQHSTRHVCVTGGEPLAQPTTLNLLNELCDKGYSVSLETSGAISCLPVDKRVHLVIDVKTPSSGEVSKFSRENLTLTERSAEFKFVICSEEDFVWAETFVRENRLNEKYNVLYSPSFTEISPKWLAEKILSQKSPARLQLQLHKYIWSPDQRGV